MKSKQMTIGLLFAGALVAGAQEAALIENGDFEKKPIKPWKVFSIKKVPATSHSVKEGKLVIEATEKGDKEFKRQLTQQVKLESNTKYLLTFKLKPTLEAPGTLRILLGRTKNPSQPHYGLWKNIEITSADEAKEHSVHFTTKEIDPADPAALRFQMGTLKGTLEFDDIELKKRS